MKLIFAGTPDFAASHLQALLEADFEIVAVYTQPDRPAGRGKKLQPSAVKTLAIKHGLTVEQPANFKSTEALNDIKAYQADLMIVVAYGLILPKNVLDTPRLGCINVHGSLLPKWRGAAPIQRAVWAGDKDTGITIMQMDEGLDTGDVLLEKTIAISKDDTSASLYAKLAELGPVALVDAVKNIESLKASKQDDTLATYAKKLSKTEAKCDWQQTVEQLERNVRAFNPWPIAWFEFNGQNVKVFNAEAIKQQHKKPAGEVITYSKDGLDIACCNGVLRITELQFPNKKRQSVSQLLNGHPTLFTPGTILQ